MGLKERAFIGLDLGGTFLKYALGKGDGTILRSGKLPSNGSQSADAIFSVMFQAITELLEAAEKEALYEQHELPLYSPKKVKKGPPARGPPELSRLHLLDHQA